MSDNATNIAFVRFMRSSEGYAETLWTGIYVAFTA